MSCHHRLLGTLGAAAALAAGAVLASIGGPISTAAQGNTVIEAPFDVIQGKITSVEGAVVTVLTPGAPAVPDPRAMAPRLPAAQVIRVNIAQAAFEEADGERIPAQPLAVGEAIIAVGRLSSLMSRPFAPRHIDEITLDAQVIEKILVYPPARSVWSGTVRGTYREQPAVPDVGRTITLSGTGTVQPLGEVTLSGTIHSLRFVHPGHAGGTLTLTDGDRRAALILTGPSQSGFSPLPSGFEFTVAAGSRPADLPGGSVHLTLSPLNRLTPRPGEARSGTFVMTFVSDGL